MLKTPRPAALDASRRRIAIKVGELRSARGLTQAALSRRLGLSQARFSQIERGDGSFSAEQLLELLQLFNVAPADFGEPPDEAADLQNALARNGASHLRENERSLPSRGLASLPEIVARTLVRADSSRQIAALAPVLVHNAEDIRFGLVERELRDAERLPRLGWVIENTLAALSLELQQTLPHRLKQSYRRAEVLLESQLEALTAGAQARSDARPWDALDKSIRSRRSLEEVSASASPISKKWRVATGIQVEDFARALSASRVD